MVLLCVKGTKFPDEFLFECNCEDSVDALTRTVTHLQNWRHKVRLQLYSMGELSETIKKGAVAAAKGACAPESAVPIAELAVRFDKLYLDTLALHKDAKHVCLPREFDDLWKRVKAITIEAFPKECTHADGEEAAVSKLWELHENPEIDEDYRLHVYHCRSLMDPQWRENEILEEDKTALWFCGKKLDPLTTLGAHCGNNAKSKLTVKVALASGPAPSGEPRMSYDDQRAMRNYVCSKREELKKLEDSELRDRVLQQARGRVIISAGGPAGGDLPVRVTGLRKGGADRDQGEAEAD
jgi:hypothetical protein